MAMTPYVPGAYSFAEVVGSIVHPVAGTQIIGGLLGIGSIAFEKVQDRVTPKITADGYSYANITLGQQGKITISCLQGSQMDQYLLGLQNDVDALLSSGQPETAIAAVVRVRDISSQNSHTAIGVGIAKEPPRDYQGEAQLRQWTLHAMELTNA